MKRVQEEHFAYLLLLLTCVLLVFPTVSTKAQVANAKAGVGAIINRIGDTTHLEFRGRKEWKYSAQKKGDTQYSITVPAIDEASVVQLQAWNCPLIKEIQVSKNAPDGNFEILLTMHSKNVDSFDYLTDSPSNLIFDFFSSDSPNPEAPAATVQAPVAQVLPEKVVPQTAKKIVKGPGRKGRSEYQKLDRKPASSELLVVDPNGQKSGAAPQVTEEPISQIGLERGLFDSADKNYDRFRIKDYQIKEESIIASQNNIYIEFPMRTRRLKRFAELMKTPPIYEITPEDTEENKTVRLLHTLYLKNRPGAFMKTYNFIQQKYPDTKYEEIAKNLLAEMHIRLYDRDHDPKDYEAYRSLYKYLIEKYPDSPLTERNQLLNAYSSLEHDDGLEALRLLQIYNLKYPNSKERDFTRLGIAEAYNLLHREESAIEMYNSIIKDPHDKESAIDAAFRIGDVYFGTKNYDKAIAVYRAAQKKYPEHAKTAAHAQYNSSEGEFWRKNYKESLDSFVDFVSMFPTHSYGGYALTRIGELLDILGAPQDKITGAYTEGYFRYPESPGSEVARLRLLSKTFPSMTERELKRALDEIDKINQHSQLPRIDEFTLLLKADGFAKREKFELSLELLLTYFQLHPTTADIGVFRSRILRNISDVLKTDIKDQKYIEALNFYGKYSTTWLKNTKRIDTEFFRAYAFERAGANAEAQKIYVKIAEQLKTISGTKEEKERRVYENLPTLSQLHLRMALIAADNRQYKEAFQQLSQIKGELTEAEEIERISVGASVAEQMGEKERAISYLTKLTEKYKEQPDKVIEPTYNLARMSLAANQNATAEKYITQIENLKKESGTVTDDVWAKTLQLKGDVQLSSGQKLAAVETYLNLLDSFEASRPLSSIRYKAGKVLFDLGDMKGAEKIWSGLASSENAEFYYKMAQEKLSQAQWQDNFKKYIDRIPAAKDLR